MLQNYFKVAFRNLLRNKGFSIINISGLAIGMASAVLILLWIKDEMGFDRFHPHQDRLYEAWTSNKLDDGIHCFTATPQLMGPALKHDYPEVEETSRVGWTSASLCDYKDKKMKLRGTWVDPAFLTMFNFPLLKGDARTALNDPYSLVITEKMAKKLFGEEDPVGKIIKLDTQDNFTVTGLLKDLPDNTQFDFEFLNSSRLLEAKKYLDPDWTDVSIRTFVLLKPKTSFADINAKIRTIDARYSGNRSKSLTFLYPVSQLRLYSDFQNGLPAGGRIESIRTFSLIAAFILLIACINFMNLSTARSEKRAKEVGIRKVAGALKRSLIGQFLGESILISLIAGAVAIIIIQTSLPAFNQLTNKQLSIDYGNIYFWLSAVGFILFTGLLAGSYPAFFLSSFRPVTVLKGTFKKAHALITPRKVLVVLQFTFAIILIISTIIVQEQIKYAQQRKAGYDKNNLIYLSLEGDMQKNYSLIRNELLRSGAAVAMSQTLSPLTDVWSAGHGLSWPGKDPNTQINFDRSNTDGNLVATAGLTLIQGRDIDLEQYPTDSTACIINESAAKIMGFANPLGQTVFDDPITWHIVGVIKDFVLTSPYEPTRPIIFKGPAYSGMTLNIRLNGKNPTAQNLAAAEKIFKRYNPAYPFEYHFVDEEYAKKFNDERLTGKLAGLFAAITIFISCLGLFGLATFMAENRIKEIGIRKVLGATVAGITLLLSRDFVKLVVLAILLASPIAWWASNRWLKGFDYRITINPRVFVIAGLSAILIALMTVGYQSVRAAIANPVKGLRSE
jgi:putative ABC transport system permease protein